MLHVRGCYVSTEVEVAGVQAEAKTFVVVLLGTVQIPEPPVAAHVQPHLSVQTAERVAGWRQAELVVRTGIDGRPKAVL